jgi:protease-4
LDGTPNRQTIAYAVAVVAALVVGGLLVPYVTFVTGSATRNQADTVAVVELEGPINAQVAERVRERLRAVRRNDSVKAVVIRVNSPGGTVPATETIYYAVNRTAAEKPVVASVAGVAASGGYFGILPADYIYATPGSPVGSVGVIGLSPGPDGVGTQIVSGADKRSGGTAADFRTQIESVKREFVATVVANRGDGLSLSPARLADAKIYIGAQAAENGLVDDVGSRADAVAHAADLAGLDSYAVQPAPDRGPVAVRLVQQGSNGSVDPEYFGFANIERPRILLLYGTLDHEEGEVTTSGGR